MRLLLVLFLIAGCGDEEALVEDLGRAVDLAASDDLSIARPPTAHAMGPIVASKGGPILAHPDVWTIAWQDDVAHASAFERFTGAMLGSSYWTNSVGEYGIGAGTSNGLIVLPTNAPATLDSGTLPDLVDSLAATHATGASTIYSFVIPAATTLEEPAGGGPVCQYGDGYHEETPNGHVLAVTFDCGGGFDGGTWTLSHELVEAATDPYPVTKPAYTSDHPPGELADLCAYPTDVTLDTGADGAAISYHVTRTYSNQAAADGTTDPCKPAPATPYFGVAADPDHLTIAIDGNGDGDGTLTLDAFAFGSVGPITWKILADPGLRFTPAGGTNKAGDVVTVQVHAHGATSGYYDAMFGVVATAGSAQGEWQGSVTFE